MTSGKPDIVNRTHIVWEVLGVGKGNSIVDWRITKGEILRGGDFELYILLQVGATDA